MKIGGSNGAEQYYKDSMKLLRNFKAANKGVGKKGILMSGPSGAQEDTSAFVGLFSARFRPTNMPFVQPNWDNIATKRDKPYMTDEEFDVAIEDLAKRTYNAKTITEKNKLGDEMNALCRKYYETVSPDRKAVYEQSMKQTGGKMNASLSFFSDSGQNLMTYVPAGGIYGAVGTDAEFARARQFTSIFHDKLLALGKADKAAAPPAALDRKV